MTNFVKIATFSYPYEYAVLKLLLEQEEIRFFFQNETAISLMPFYTNSKGGIFLKVHPEDVSQAQRIITEFYKKNDLHIV